MHLHNFHSHIYYGKCIRFYLSKYPVWTTDLKSTVIGASEAKPLSSGWCETGSHGTSKPDGTAVETGWYGRRNRMVRPYVGEGPTTCTWPVSRWTPGAAFYSDPCWHRGTEPLPGEAGLGQFAHRSAGTTLLGAQCRANSCTRLLHLQTLNQPTPVWFTYVGSPWTADLCQERGCGPGRTPPPLARMQVVLYTKCSILTNQSNESQHAPEVSKDIYNIGYHSHVTSHCMLSHTRI